MAKGRPDFFGVSIHPKFGTSQFVYGTTDIDPPVETEVITVLGKGVMAGGYIYSADFDGLITDVVGLFIDDTRIAYSSFSVLNHRGLLADAKLPVVLLEYNLEIPSFSAGFPLELPFEESFSIKYTVSGVNTVTVGYQMSYYTIQ